MHLTSTLDSLSKSDGSVPVAIFSLGEQRKLLRVSEDYQDTLRLVAESFDLEEDVVLSLRTSTIDVFQGKEVEIDESAYVYVRPCLGQVNVSVVERVQVGRRQQKRAQEKSRAISPIAPDYPLEDDLEDFPAASSTVIHQEAPVDEQPSGAPILDGIGKGIGGSSKVIGTTTMGEKVDHSQKSKKHTDDEHSDNQREVVQEKFVLLKTADLRPIAEPEDHDEGGSSSLKRFRPAGAFFPKSNKEISSPVTVKKEIVAEPANEVKLNTSAAQPEEDPRFEITITGPQNQTAQFKTRGKHPVRKVLAAACKTFGVKYERARLVVSFSTEEGGETQTDEFVCPTEETMSQCGVDGNATLFVRVEPDHDDEEYEED